MITALWKQHLEQFLSHPARIFWDLYLFIYFYFRKSKCGGWCNPTNKIIKPYQKTFMWGITKYHFLFICYWSSSNTQLYKFQTQEYNNYEASSVMLRMQRRFTWVRRVIKFTAFFIFLFKCFWLHCHCYIFVRCIHFPL